ncbi:MAG: hypothetical protein JWO77_476 [Ilumatobacteraceae bacterium]|nr:hypothetical protein [Ilumatobacteraceae bacterium]
MTRFAAVAALAATAVFVGLAPGAASAHTLASSSVTIELTDHDASGTISLAVASLDKAFTAGHRSKDLSAAEYQAQVVDYLDEHLTVRGADGVPWAEDYRNFARQTVEGIETITVDVDFDVETDDPADFAITYDAIIEAVSDHEAVLVLVDASNRASTPGVFTTSENTLTVGEGATAVGLLDMTRFGFHHVLDGADHLLFLLTLLLPAPLIVASGKWQRGPGLGWSVRKVIHVVTAFTIGHSLTLLATSLGWIRVPGRPVEVLIAASVAVSAVHAIRPLVRGGEPVIAGTFGLIHGMAFAGILADLGLSGRTSVVTLLAFNVGIELAQLLATACVFPSLYLMATRQSYTAVRVGGASLALAASGGWMLGRLGLVSSPFDGIEGTLIRHPWGVVIALAVLAIAVRLLDHRNAQPPTLKVPTSPDDDGAAPPVLVPSPAAPRLAASGVLARRPPP